MASSVQFVRQIARLLPAYQPQWDVRRGAEQLYEVYRSTKLTLDEFEGPRYQRISHVKKLIADGVLGEDLRHVEAPHSPWRVASVA